MLQLSACKECAKKPLTLQCLRRNSRDLESLSLCCPIQNA